MLFMWYLTLTDFQMLNQFCTSGINPIWSWYIILFIHCWILFSSVLLYFVLVWFSGVRSVSLSVSDPLLDSHGWDCGISLRNMPLECMGKEGKCMWSCSVVSDSQQPHGLQSIRLLHPWDFPGKSARVDCHFLLQKKESKSKIRNGSGSVYEKDTQERYNLVPKIVQLKDLGVWFHSFLSTHSTILLRLIETDPDTLRSEPPGKSKK